MKVFGTLLLLWLKKVEIIRVVRL